MLPIAVGVGVFLILVSLYFMLKKKDGNETSAAALAAEAPAPEEEPEEDKYPAGKVSVYFGSQTGTAEGFAKTLEAEGNKYEFDVNVVDLEDFELEELQEDKMAVFLMATYGEGEPTDNAVEFHRTILNTEEELEKDALQDLNFAVFGLGNRQYEHYNSMGIATDALLEGLGANRAYKYGDGDDDADLEEDFDVWKEDFWESMLEKFYPAGLEKLKKEKAAGGGKKKNAPAPKLSFRVNLYADKQEAHKGMKKNNTNVDGKGDYFMSKPAKVVVNREIRQNTVGGSTKHIEIDIEGTPLSYAIADNLAVLPKNDPALVKSLASVMNYDLEKWIEMVPADAAKAGSGPPFPTPCTVETALSQYCDLSAMPKKGLLNALVFFAKDDKDRARIAVLTGKQGKEEFNKFITDPGRNLVEVLQELSSVQIPLEHFLEMVPRLQPRYYTISSTPSVHPNQIHSTVSVVNEKRSEGRVFKGVCSNFMDITSTGDDATPTSPTHMDVFVRPSTFKLPKAASVPVVMVGPGTGIAPMRAFLQEKRKQKENGDSIGDVVLYFGCRKKDEDFIYEDELLGYTNDGTLTALHTAFSREQVDKVYVQDKLRDNGEETWKLLEEKKACFYVCGGTSMGKDVMSAVETIATKQGGLSAAAAAAYVKKLQKDGRYIQELWS